MLKPFFLSLIAVLPLTLAAQSDPAQFVNPLVGTQNMGHTYPGATVPFGMVQLSPDTDTTRYELNGSYNPEVYRYCAGYQYEDPTIVGFSHTHFSGTGHSDLGDFLIMPTTGELQLHAGSEEDPSTGYRSAYSHDNEIAEPGYYSVLLEDHGIEAELTSTNRVGIHRYTFPEEADGHIILDLEHGIYTYDEKNVWTFVRVENDSTVTGFRQTDGWARTRTVYFAMSFSKPFTSYGHEKDENDTYRGFWRKFDESKNFPEMIGKDIRAYFNFDVEEGEEVMLKFALSSVSTEGAIKNLQAEAAHWDFDQYRSDARALWNKELSKVEVETITRKDKETFYTALYHTFLGPITYMDVDGRYKGLDQNTHTAEDFTNYTIFSLWDTYRALHPWFNIVQQQRNRDMVYSMLAHYDQSAHHMLPIWSHYANENWCMIGYHSVSVISDAYIKGIISGDIDRALEASVTTAKVPYYDGIGYYMDLGYVPEDQNTSSVSKTLEYAYDDWAISQLAKKAGNTEVETEFKKRSRNFENVYDERIGFMRPRLSDGSFKQEFDEMDTHGQGFIEGNAWNYSLYVPHDPDRMIEMMGGKDRFSEHLDSLFVMEIEDKYIDQTEDITRDGIIGNYVHGNEPGHHIPYLYNWTNDPWKTQERVRMIMDTMYSNTSDGLPGNDDAGQMSAWYLFSAIGFYPVAPGADWYAIGSPNIRSATINLESGHTVTIEALNQSEENIYVQNLSIDGKTVNRNYLLHNELMNADRIVFTMGSKPNTEWGTISPK
ncbi:GH92 family glycosyl hydrolase [Balneola sp. MJW-20]|uniref:GH92 family glycosyl hydrolase n=1 Tax=Gracilimonas aurantiaca TaxID=3234185 RepID=UPI003465F723